MNAQAPPSRPRRLGTRARALRMFSFTASIIPVAAALCGVPRGWVPLRFRSPWLDIVSHAVWDVLMFVLIPIR